MKLFIVIIIIGLISSQQGLVHYIKMEGTKKGCKGPEGEMEVGQYVQDKNTCGVIVCQNSDGDALLHYCQKPAGFQLKYCKTDGVNTELDFPLCCFTCVLYKSC